MNAYSPEFYDPLAIALDGARLQDFVDEILASYNRLDVAGFSFNEDLLPDFTYSQVQRELKMDVMASYVDLDSPAIPVAVEGDVLATGKIPRMKAVDYYNEDKLRKLKMLENRRDYNRQAVIDKAGVELGNIFVNLVNRHANSLSYQRDQIVSKGKFEITSTNNPNGIQSVTFANHVPSANKTTLLTNLRWWTDHTLATEGASADPIKDLKAMVKAAANKGVRRCHFEVNDVFADSILEHSAVKGAISAAIFPNAGSSAWAEAALAGYTRAQKLDILGRIAGAPFVLRDGQASVEKWDSVNNKLTRPQMDTFEKYVVVLVPDGSLGEILTVEPILLEGGEYAFAFGNKLAITIGKDFVKKCQSYNSEMTSLVVPDKPQYMWYLFPCES